MKNTGNNRERKSVNSTERSRGSQLVLRKMKRVQSNKVGFPYTIKKLVFLIKISFVGVVLIEANSCKVSRKDPDLPSVCLGDALGVIQL